MSNLVEDRFEMKENRGLAAKRGIQKIMDKIDLSHRLEAAYNRCGLCSIALVTAVASAVLSTALFIALGTMRNSTAEASTADSFFTSRAITPTGGSGALATGEEGDAEDGRSLLFSSNNNDEPVEVEKRQLEDFDGLFFEN